MFDDDMRDVEDAELRALREMLIADAEDAAYLEGRRLRREARAFQIARDRMDRGPASSRAQEMEVRSIALELGAPLHLHDRTMQTRMADAADLVEHFDATVAALEEGRLSRRHADEILHAGRPLEDPEVRAAFERVVLEFAEKNTPARTRAYARQIAEKLHPRSIDERFADANDRRLVSVTELDDGMAELRAYLPVTLAFGIHDRLTRMAVTLKADDDRARNEHRAAMKAAVTAADADADRRGLSDAARGDARDAALAAVVAPEFDDRVRDQVRADLLTDLLLTGTPAIDPTTDAGLGAVRGHVQITIPVTTLTGVTSGGGELNGRSAVDDDTARRLAGNAPGWDRVFNDPVTGTVLEVDRYEPLACQRRFLHARDVRCRAPGCRRPAHDTQIDHNHERRHGGRTRLSNLAGFCVRHHTVKTETDWVVSQLPGGSLHWTSPLGYTYRDDPPPRVVFVPDRTPAPF